MKKVLIVDNEPQLAELIYQATMLSGMVDGRNLFQAYSAELGRTYARSRFDILLVDWDLGDGTGSEVIEEARRSNPEVIVIVMSGRAIDDSEIWSSGPDLMISKPFELPGLTQVIKTYLAA